MDSQEKHEALKDAVKEINKQFYGPHDFVQTSPCGRGQHHPHGLVGRLWRIKDPKTVSVGNCFLSGRLKPGDLFLCVEHSGDCFQTYIYIEEYTNCMIAQPQWSFGSYGIGDAEPTELTEVEFVTLKNEGQITIDNRKTARILGGRRCKMVGIR